MTLAERLRFCADQDGVSTDTHNELIECAEIVEELVEAARHGHLAIRTQTYTDQKLAEPKLAAALKRAMGEV